MTSQLHRMDLGRRASLRPAVAVVLLWTAATAFALVIARWTAVGPVVLVLGPAHGVHVGDLVALVAAYTEAAVLTRRVLLQV